MGVDPLQTLGLCRRAGKLAAGFDMVKQSVRRGQACLLAVSEEISPKTKKELEYLSRQGNLPMVILAASLNDLWYITGQRAGVFSITDPSLAEKLRRELGANGAGAKQEETE